MEYTILIQNLPEGFVPEDGMMPFHIVRQIHMMLPASKLLSTVGIRYAGYFRCTGEGDAKDALAALKYGLLQGQYAVGSSTEIDFDTLFTDRLPELLEAANHALVESESPFQLEKVVFGYLEYCVHDGSFGQKNQRYTGIIMGSGSVSHQVTAYRPSGIPGEWQCVCGSYNPPGKCCTECKTPRPVISFLPEE